MKIVFHIDELAKWQSALANIKNALTYAQTTSTDLKMAVVVNGPAITGYTDSEIRSFIETHASVAFHACQNAMQGHQIKATQLPSGVTVMPAGIIDLAQLQDQGFRYVKP
ncbi:DsrE family protein [Pediococcus siamensis]|uniref:DsrE family protein n=1 Tax=Pediococcus siamensis TaxID=381829 RepID=UPI0039A291AD